MPIPNWVVLLFIAHGFSKLEALNPARCARYSGAALSSTSRSRFPLRQLRLALEDLVRRPQPFQQSEITDLSCAIIARLVRVREKLRHCTSHPWCFAFQSEPWPR